MSQVVHLQKTDISQAVHRTVQALREGKLIVFPTETVYGLGVLASCQKAVARLISAKGRKPGHALPVAISGTSALPEYIDTIDKLTERLTRRCWPGPLTLVIDGTSPNSVIRKLAPEVQKAIMPAGTVGLRVPDNPFFLEVLRQIDEPVILTSANLTGEPPAVSANMAKVGLGDDPDLIIDDGPANFQTPSTVVRIQDGHCSMVREGVISAKNLKQLTAKLILFVCTGNTCRSPMAQIICSKILADELHCQPSELEDNGYLILSAGIATIPGSTASDGAKNAVKSLYGLSLDEHASQLATELLLRFADHIFVMGKSHRTALLDEMPHLNSRISLLRKDGGDISDPLGHSDDVYEQCARQIEQEIRNRLPEIME